MKQADDAVGAAAIAKTRDRDRLELEEMRVATASLLELARTDPEEAARQTSRVCPHCEALQLPKIQKTPLPWDAENESVVWPAKCGCKGAEEARIEDERRQAVADEMTVAQLAQRRLDRAGLTGRLSVATFENFDAREDWPPSAMWRTEAEAYANAVIEGSLGESPWLVLCGEFGTGKTHLAAAIARRCIDAGMSDVYFRSWLAYTERLKASWEDDALEKTSEIQAELMKGSLVVLDDLDKKRATDWAREVLYPVVNHRYNEGLPTVLTFNMAPDAKDKVTPGRYALEVYLGAAMLDRIVEAARAIVLFDGPSYRSGVRWTEPSLLGKKDEPRQEWQDKFD